MNFSPELEKASEMQLHKWINKVGPVHAALASEELSRCVNKKLLSEMKSLSSNLKKESESANRFSKIAAAFALIQAVTGIFQLMVAIQTGSLNQWLGAVIIIIFAGITHYILKKFDPII